LNSIEKQIIIAKMKRPPEKLKSPPSKRVKVVDWRTFLKDLDKREFFKGLVPGSQAYLKKLGEAKRLFESPKESSGEPMEICDHTKEMDKMNVERTDALENLLLCLEDMGYEDDYIDSIPGKVESGDITDFLSSLVTELCHWNHRPPPNPPYTLKALKQKIEEIVYIPLFIRKDLGKLLGFVVAEIQAMRINPPEERKLEPFEEISMSLESMCENLGIENMEFVEGPDVVKAIIAKVHDIVEETPRLDQPSLLLHEFFDPTQMGILRDINSDFAMDYSMRKKMLVTRFHALTEVIQKSHRAPKSIPDFPATDISFSHWSALCFDKHSMREDIVKPCKASLVHKYRIPVKIPDRGGRPNDVRNIFTRKIPFSHSKRDRKDRFHGRKNSRKNR